MNHLVDQADMFMGSGPITTAMRDRTIPYKRGSETSKAAAELVRPKTPSYRAAIEGFLKGRGAQGATNDEVMATLSIQIQTVCPRMKELRVDGLVIDSGRTRKTRSGREAVVWVCKEYAQ